MLRSHLCIRLLPWHCRSIRRSTHRSWHPVCCSDIPRIPTRSHTYCDHCTDRLPGGRGRPKEEGGGRGRRQERRRIKGRYGGGGLQRQISLSQRHTHTHNRPGHCSKNQCLSGQLLEEEERGERKPPGEQVPRPVSAGSRHQPHSGSPWQSVHVT